MSNSKSTNENVETQTEESTKKKRQLPSALPVTSGVTETRTPRGVVVFSKRITLNDPVNLHVVRNNGTDQMPLPQQVPVSISEVTLIVREIVSGVMMAKGRTARLCSIQLHTEKEDELALVAVSVSSTGVISLRPYIGMASQSQRSDAAQRTYQNPIPADKDGFGSLQDQILIRNKNGSLADETLFPFFESLEQEYHNSAEDRSSGSSNSNAMAELMKKLVGGRG